MSVRFRIRTPAGQELSFATLEIFEDFVRSGDLSPDDLVYDADDGSWSPARTHPMVLDIEYQKEETAAAEEVEEEPAAAVASAGDDEEKGGSFGLSLAPEQPRGDDEDEAQGAEAGDADGASASDQKGDRDADAESDPIAAAAAENAFGLALAPESELSEEDATRAFVEKMEAEREASLDLGSGASVQGFSMDDSSTLADMLTPAPAPPEPAPRERPPAPRAKPSTPRPSPREPKPRPAKTGGGGGGFGRLLLMIVGLGVVGGAGYFGYQTFGGVQAPEPDPTAPIEPLPVEPEPELTPEPVIAQTEAAIRDRAQERFLTSTQNALRDLPPIPETWATGTYFSVPSDYPEVVTAWESYLNTVRAVRSEDLSRYADAYELALDDAAIAADDRDERRERALSEFGTSEEARAAHYDRVEALASAAIQSHSALVESEGLILYEAGSSAGGETGMGAGAYGRDAEADLLLSQVVDLLTGSLDADGLGPGEGAAVRAWVWDGFLDAATR